MLAHSNRHIIMLDKYDFGITQIILNHIVDLHNQGMHYKEIAKEIRRESMEIIITLLHVADEGKRSLRSIAYLNPIFEKLKAEKGAECTVVATVDKVKKGVATVILIDGKRYVYEPQGR